MPACVPVGRHEPSRDLISHSLHSRPVKRRQLNVDFAGNRCSWGEVGEEGYESTVNACITVMNSYCL